MWEGGGASSTFRSQWEILGRELSGDILESFALKLLAHQEAKRTASNELSDSACSPPLSLTLSLGHQRRITLYRDIIYM